jgi:hypothetical protein
MPTSTDETISAPSTPRPSRGQQTAAGGEKRASSPSVRSVEITGRVVVRLTAVEEFKGSKYDID